MTAFVHQPVLLDETLEALAPVPGKLHLDGTIGGGGHAEAVLDASSPDGKLIGFDRDSEALEAAKARLSRFSDRAELRQSNFAEMLDFVAEESCDSILLDLGVSSPQLDRPSRGFAFKAEGPLDMRMDQSQGETAADIINTWPAEDLANLFFQYGDERQSRRIAREIEARRKLRKFSTTTDLADFIEQLMPRHGQKTHPATRIFQALRMAVNDELGSLEDGLEASWKALKPGGRLAVITFHSLEDRTVKQFGKALCRDYDFEGEVDLPDFRTYRAPQARWLSKKAIQPSAREQAQNPRARSAQLRALQKLEGAEHGKV